MTTDEIVKTLKSLASEKYKANVVRMGIPEEFSIGVPTADVRKLAKQLKKSNDLAFDLWNTGYHEARILAVLLFDKKEIGASDIERLISDVQSWDLCDHLCKNLIIKRNDYENYIVEWAASSQTYKKRAAFTLIAADVIHNKKISEGTLDEYLKLIYENSSDEHEHIKKAVSWALREIGKKDFKYNEKALLLAHDLMENGNKAQVWIAKDAVKELENTVKAEGRERLISANTKMGSNPLSNVRKG
ncbi:DNA alkylation repair protein [Clostridium sp. AM58-1XD]|uniref:DNA alkylation repair protein n=1 Tax=Clostridium sp. AM58-1XD TaxID=2292307 RepID=UPI000E52BD63|nr:DNA alkylation repair protein [Clostridium sp. AM58-1XD]RGY98904.1 DNA alkylation repair protein [Clostridium sp. AM58-1XD]